MMRQARILAASAVVMVTSACETAGPSYEQRASLNAWLADSIHNAAMENAIIAQHTLFRYQFVRNAALLNELGKRDLDILAAHFKEHPGRLNIRRGDVAADLYEARVKRVVEVLTKAGVGADAIAIADALPGGDGMPSERVLTILEGAQTQASNQSPGSSGVAQAFGGGS